MGRKIEISWESATASEISVAKRCAPTQRGFVRFQSFEFLRAGYSQGEVACLSGRAVRTIRRWIEAFSAKGLDGLALKGGSGRPQVTMEWTRLRRDRISWRPL